MEAIDVLLNDCNFTELQRIKQKIEQLEQTKLKSEEEINA